MTEVRFARLARWEHILIVGHGRRDPESGQTLAEYAVVLAGIAVVCVVAALFLGAAIGSRVGGTAQPAPPAPFQPPVPAPQLVWPTRLENCEDGGWRNFVQFDNEAECKDYVNGLTP